MPDKKQRRSVLAHWRVVAARLKDTERQVDILLTATTCYSAEGKNALAADTAQQARARLCSEMSLINQEMSLMEKEIERAQEKVGVTKCIFK